MGGRLGGCNVAARAAPCTSGRPGAAWCLGRRIAACLWRRTLSGGAKGMPGSGKPVWRSDQARAARCCAGSNFALGRLLAMPQQCPVSSLVARRSAAVRSVRRSSLSSLSFGRRCGPAAGGGQHMAAPPVGGFHRNPAPAGGRAGREVSEHGGRAHTRVGAGGMSRDVCRVFVQGFLGARMTQALAGCWKQWWPRGLGRGRCGPRDGL